MNDSDKDMKLIDDALRVLGEHFDTVQIFATRHEAGELDGTVNINKGTGNWFARWGQIQAWTTKTKGEQLERGRKSENEE